MLIFKIAFLDLSHTTFQTLKLDDLLYFNHNDTYDSMTSTHFLAWCSSANTS
jgi:hypothetical protein